MKTIGKTLLKAVVMTTFGLSLSTSAQNADHEEIRRQTERFRQSLGVTDNDEWAIISERLAKVIELRNAGGGRGGNRDDRRRGGRGQGQGGRDRDQTERGQVDRERDRAQADRGGRGTGQGDRARGGQGDRAQGGGGQGDRGRNVDPNSPQGKLQDALERNSSKGEMNRLLEAFRAERESNARKLEQARAALREVVTVRQEVVLVLNRLLD